MTDDEKTNIALSKWMGWRQVPDFKGQDPKSLWDDRATPPLSTP